MSIIGWILFGLIVGVVGKLLMPGRDQAVLFLRFFWELPGLSLADSSGGPWASTVRENRQGS
jgi:uncharacterized membrane protein YeaQ/YmgE (transglycosylase-associated protein family)